MKRISALLTPRWAARCGVACLLAVALAPPAAGPAGASPVCKDCASTSNDTTFTPGIVGTDPYASMPVWDPVLSFIGSDHLLRCAMPAYPGWQIETVDAASVAAGCAMVIEAPGAPGISYHDGSGRLYYAHRVGGTWLRESVDPGAIAGGATSVAIVPNGIGIAYYDSGAAMLKYAERLPGGAWLPAPVAATGGTRDHCPSLASLGTSLAIGYYDAAQGTLRLALGQGSAWTTALVDAAGDVGGYASLVASPSTGTLGIAYYDFTNGALKYAFGSPDAMSIEFVDGATADVGRFCSAVAFGTSVQDRVGIGYYDRTNGSLKYALKRGGAWQLSVQDAAGGPVACAATPAPNDTVGLACVDRATGDLNYQWHANTVESAPLPVRPSGGLDVAWLSSPGGAGGVVRFTVPVAGPVRVTIYDAQGRMIAAPLSRELPAGSAEARWDAQDMQGRAVAAGVCFARVETRGGAGSVRAVILR